mmetsp:Transcript_6577/g.16381  ORF Transcript_6577/g.16381 Transcript_6577/m.16381 type:complete len:155 (-) Transcript_6577:2463-2927(-)
MAFVAKKGPGPGAYDVKSNMGEGPSPSVRGRLGVFDKSSGVLNTMQSEFLRGIYKKEEQYYGKNDNAGNVLFQTAARNIVPHKANFDDLVKKFPERENPSTQEQLTSNLHSNVFGNANREPHSRYVSAAKRAMLEGMEGELKVSNKNRGGVSGQ